jgi:transposase-like protein
VEHPQLAVAGVGDEDEVALRAVADALRLLQRCWCGWSSRRQWPGASGFGVSLGTVRKWVERFRAQGAAGLVDRSSRPGRLRRPTPPAVRERIVALRRQRWCGRQIAKEVGVSPATVSRVLRRSGLSRMRDLDPAQPVRRYECRHPGELIHIDIKKLGRFGRIGHRITGDRRGQSSSRGEAWECVQVCIDDASRLAFSQVMPDEKKGSAVAFLRAAVAYYESLGVAVARCFDTRNDYRAVGNMRFSQPFEAILVFEGVAETGQFDEGGCAPPQPD